jgi:type VII secretion-associated serine protease mycosin
MDGGTARSPIATVTAAVVMSVATVATPAAAAVAAPRCSALPAPAEPVTTLPWAQQRYAPERLAPIADGRGVTVAVVDSGIDTTHPQMRDAVAGGTDFLDPGGDGRTDCAGHGTGVASIIVGAPSSGVRFRGLAPRARILSVRVSELHEVEGKQEGRTVGAADFGRAIRWAVDNGADVINLSVVYYRDDPAVRGAVAYAVGRDVVVVAAVGNRHEQGNPDPYPAAYGGVLGVGAIGADSTRQQYSQTGRYVDVMAPGGEVLTAAPRRGHRLENGTSYAAPFVSATVALVRQRFRQLSAAKVIERVIATADPAPGGRHSDTYGAGVVNPYRAVTEAVSPGRPQPVAALPTAQVDPAAVAARERRAESRRHALWFAGAAAAVVAAVVVIAVVLPRGSRRRWRPADPA